LPAFRAIKQLVFHPVGSLLVEAVSCAVDPLQVTGVQFSPDTVAQITAKHPFDKMRIVSVLTPGGQHRLKISVVPQMAVEAREGCRFIPLSDEIAYRRLGYRSVETTFL
jgi:hypothetical protein